jgi:Flp pilus assembly pilin Flp
MTKGKLKRNIFSFIFDLDGAELVEYAVAVGVVAIAALLVYHLGKYVGLINDLHPVPTPTPVSSPSPAPSPTLQQIIAEELRKLAEGQIVFAVPENMKQGKSERVEVRISSKQIGPKLTEGLKSRGTPLVEDIKVAKFMKVFLYGEENEFRIIKSPDTEQQIVTERDYAQWEWQVTPLSFGEQTLYLKATAVIPLAQVGEKTIDVPLMEKTINVSVSPMYVVSSTAKKFDWWQFLLGGGVLFGVPVAIWRYLTRRKRRPIGF